MFLKNTHRADEVGRGGALHLTKDMNDHMVYSHFQVKGDS